MIQCYDKKTPGSDSGFSVAFKINVNSLQID